MSHLFLSRNIEGGNAWTGYLPAAIGNLSMLQRLQLPYNWVRGAIPPQLGRLGRLTEMDLTCNGLTGCAPVAPPPIPARTPPNGGVIEAPWLVNGGHGASLSRAPRTPPARPPTHPWIRGAGCG
jgi:hypothetical protein